MTVDPALEEQPQPRDPVIVGLVKAVIIALIAALTLSLYVLASGILTSTPRTLAEKRMAMLKVTVSDTPQSARAWGDYARALIDAGRLEAAESVLRSAKHAVGADAPEVLLEQGRLALVRGEEIKAALILEKADQAARAARSEQLADLEKRGIMPDPRVVKGDVIEAAALLRAGIHESRGEWPNVLRDYRIVLAENPVSADAYAGRGFAYLEIGDFAKAKADFDAALRLVPDHAKALEGLERLRDEGR